MSKLVLKKRKDCNNSVVIIRTEKGEYVGFFGIVSDLIEMKVIENDINEVVPDIWILVIENQEPIEFTSREKIIKFLEI